MMDPGAVSLGLAFLAGLVSFLSPCVFPIVPSYVGFVTGLTLDELRDGATGEARRQAAIHGGLFVLGFSALFVALGASATALGEVLRRSTAGAPPVPSRNHPMRARSGRCNTRADSAAAASPGLPDR